MIEDSGIVIDLGTAEYCRKYMEKKIANAEKRWEKRERKRIKEKDIQMVKRMLEEKISYEIISKVTDLSFDEIKKIENEINQGKSWFFCKNYHLTIDSANKSDIIVLAQKEKEC